MADKEERGNRPEAKQRFVEDGLPLMTRYAAISAFCSQKQFEIGSILPCLLKPRSI